MVAVIFKGVLFAELRGGLGLDDFRRIGEEKGGLKSKFFSFFLINVYPKILVFPQLSVKTLTKFYVVQYFNIMVHQIHFPVWDVRVGLDQLISMKRRLFYNPLLYRH